MRKYGLRIASVLATVGFAGCSGEFGSGVNGSGVGATPDQPSVGDDAMMAVAEPSGQMPGTETPAAGSGATGSLDTTGMSGAGTVGAGAEPTPDVALPGDMTETEMPGQMLGGAGSNLGAGAGEMVDPMPEDDAEEPVTDDELGDEEEPADVEDPEEDPAEEDPAEEDPAEEDMTDEMNPVMAQELPMTDHCAAVADWDPMWVQWEEEVLLLVNEARAAARSCGSEGSFEATEPLTMNSTLTCAARLHSLDMYERDFFAHDNPDGVSPSQRVTDAGYEWGTTGENIAYGYGSPEQVMEGWLDSDGHCSNIMQSNYTEIGVGYYPGDAGGQRFAQNAHYWTQNFGAPRGEFGGGGGFGGGGFGGFGQ